MSDTPRLVTGVFRSPSGQVYPNKTIVIYRRNRKVVAQGSSVVVDDVERTTLNAQGEIEVSLLPGAYLGRIALEDADRYFEFGVPEGSGGYLIEDAIENASPFIEPAIVAAAQAARDKAQEWAESPTAPGDPGTKSSKTHAEDAAASAVEAAIHGPRQYPTAKDLMDDTAAKYPDEGAAMYAGGAPYIVKGPLATDFDVQTAAGIKLLVPDAVNPGMLGGLRDGSDITDALQEATEIARKRKYDAVILPRGEYGFDQLTFYKQLSLAGVGMAATRLFALGGDKRAVIIDTDPNAHPNDGTDALPHVGGGVRHLSLFGDIGTKQGTGFWWKDAWRFHMHKVTVKNFYKGMDTAGASWSSGIDACWIVRNEFGITLGGTDTNHRQYGEVGFSGTFWNTGMNGSTISRNEIQGNGVGIYGPNFNLDSTQWYAHGLTIRNNIIQGNDRQAFIYNARLAGLTYAENYHELNCRSTNIDVRTDTLTLADDILEYNAVVVMDTPNTLAPAFTGVTFERNHFTNHDIGGKAFNTAVAFYVDRASRSVRFIGNGGFLPGIAARQRNTDFNHATFTMRDNRLGSVTHGYHTLDSAFASRVYVQNDENLADNYPAATSITTRSPQVTTGTEKHSGLIVSARAGNAVVPNVSTDPQTDLANLSDGEMIFNQLCAVAPGTSWPGDGNGYLTAFKRALGTWRYSWQEFTDTFGAKFRRVAQSATEWGPWQRMVPPSVAFANDTAAAAGGVSVGDMYKKTDGTIVWRQA